MFLNPRQDVLTNVARPNSVAPDQAESPYNLLICDRFAGYNNHRSDLHVFIPVGFPLYQSLAQHGNENQQHAAVDTADDQLLKQRH